MKEIWVAAVNNRYEVSNMGRVRAIFLGTKKLNKPRILSPAKNNRGYYMVTLTDWHGKIKGWKLSRLALSSFDKPMPSNIHCRHLDDNKENNCLYNLAWGTIFDNLQDRVNNGKNKSGTLGNNVKLTKRKIIKMRQLYSTGKYSCREIAEIFGSTRPTVFDAVTYKTWKKL